MYDINISRQAKKKLQALPNPLRIHIAGQIYRLGCDPDDKKLDVKKLRGLPGYRLRVGQWRVIFERYDQVKIISIEKIGPRGDIYK